MNQQLDLLLAALTPGNRLACQVMLHTGLRIGDVLSLPAVALGPSFRVWEHKTGKWRRVRLPAWLLAELKEHSGRSPWVFPSPRDPQKHRTRQAVWKDLKRAERAFRLKVNAGTHSMRKVYAVELLRKYGDLERVRRDLGHEYVSTTILYALADQLTETARQRPRRRRA